VSGASNSADPWFQAMVGQWWTPPPDLSIVGAAATKRRTTSAAWQSFSNQLRQELSGSLSPELQKGMAADSIREAFTWGADQADDVAKTNGVISDAHHSSQQCVHDLNSRLETIAHNGKSEINTIASTPPACLAPRVRRPSRSRSRAFSARPVHHSRLHPIALNRVSAAQLRTAQFRQGRFLVLRRHSHSLASAKIGQGQHKWFPRTSARQTLRASAKMARGLSWARPTVLSPARSQASATFRTVATHCRPVGCQPPRRPAHLVNPPCRLHNRPTPSCKASITA
jgi:hypothetical protein